MLQGVQVLGPEPLVVAQPAIVHLAQRLRVQMVPAFPPGPSPIHQPGAPEDADMPAHRRTADAWESLRDVAGPQRPALAQEVQNSSPCVIGDGPVRWISDGGHLRN